MTPQKQKGVLAEFNGARLAFKNTKFLLIVLKIMFIISAAAMTFMLSLRGNYLVCIASVVLSLLIFVYLTFKKDLFKTYFSDINIIILFVSIILCSSFVLPLAEGLIINHPDEYISFVGIEFSKNIARLSIFAVVVLFYIFIKCFFDGAKIWFKLSDTIERRFLFTTFGALSVLTIVLYLSTDIFYLPEFGDSVVQYNVLFSNDTGDLLLSDVYSDINAPQNDLRHPLFAVFSLPFSMTAHFISEFLLFDRAGYPILMNIIQVFLFTASMVTVARMLKLSGSVKTLFLIAVTVSYPFLLNSLNMEQYVFSVFWLLMFIYFYTEDLKGKEYLFIASTGSLLTSGYMFPLLTKQGDSVKNKVISVFNGAVKTFAFITVFGQLPVFFRVFEQVNHLVGFSRTEVAATTKIVQFFDFVAWCFVAPKTGIDALSETYISLEILPTDSLNIAGVALFAVAVIGFVLNHKNSFARICFAWVLFSIALLVIGGWGVDLNDLILYVGYFSWSFISLVYLFLDRVFKKTVYKISAMSVLILCLLYFNINGIADIVGFGIEYYKV